jgi:hypothetical protein
MAFPDSSDPSVGIKMCLYIAVVFPECCAAGVDQDHAVALPIFLLPLAVPCLIAVKYDSRTRQPPNINCILSNLRFEPLLT